MKKDEQHIISCKDITKIFGTGETKTQALRGISCDIELGEFVSIMGPSGSGKSTLMHILSFLDRATDGQYFYKGEDTNKFDEKKLAYIRNQEIGFIFQAFNLMQRVSVFENVELPLLYNFYKDNKSKNTNKEKIIRALKSVGMEHRANHTPNQLSGGEKQRIAIARALINNPQIIFADEPTGNLDSKSGLQVMKILQDLNEHGHTIILVTHERGTAEHANRILRIVDGRIVGDEKVQVRKLAKKENELK